MTQGRCQEYAATNSYHATESTSQKTERNREPWRRNTSSLSDPSFPRGRIHIPLSIQASTLPSQFATLRLHLDATQDLGSQGREHGKMLSSLLENEGINTFLFACSMRCVFVSVGSWMMLDRTDVDGFVHIMESLVGLSPSPPLLESVGPSSTFGITKPSETWNRRTSSIVPKAWKRSRKEEKGRKGTSWKRKIS